MIHRPIRAQSLVFIEPELYHDSVRSPSHSDDEDDTEVTSLIIKRLSTHLEALKIEIMKRLGLFISEEELLELKDMNTIERDQSLVTSMFLLDDEIKLLLKYWKEEVVLRVKSGMIRKEDQESYLQQQFMSSDTSEMEKQIALLTQSIKDQEQLTNKQSTDIMLLSSLINRREQMLDIQRKQYLQEVMLLESEKKRNTNVNPIPSKKPPAQSDLHNMIHCLHQSLVQKMKDVGILVNRLRVVSNDIDLNFNSNLSPRKKKNWENEIESIERESENLATLPVRCKECEQFKEIIESLRRELSNERLIGKLRFENVQQQKLLNKTQEKRVQDEDEEEKVRRRDQSALVFKLQERISRMSAIINAKNNELDEKGKEIDNLNQKNKKLQSRVRILTTDLQKTTQDRDHEKSKFEDSMVSYHRLLMMKEDLLSRLVLAQRDIDTIIVEKERLESEREPKNDVREMFSQTDSTVEMLRTIHKESQVDFITRNEVHDSETQTSIINIEELEYLSTSRVSKNSIDDIIHLPNSNLPLPLTSPKRSNHSTHLFPPSNDPNNSNPISELDFKHETESQQRKKVKKPKHSPIISLTEQLLKFKPEENDCVTSLERCKTHDRKFEESIMCSDMCNLDSIENESLSTRESTKSEWNQPIEKIKEDCTEVENEETLINDKYVDSETTVSTPRKKTLDGLKSTIVVQDINIPKGNMGIEEARNIFSLKNNAKIIQEEPVIPEDVKINSVQYQGMSQPRKRLTMIDDTSGEEKTDQLLLASDTDSFSDESDDIELVGHGVPTSALMVTSEKHFYQLTEQKEATQSETNCSHLEETTKNEKYMAIEDDKKMLKSFVGEDRLTSTPFSVSIRRKKESKASRNKMEKLISHVVDIRNGLRELNNVKQEARDVFSKTEGFNHENQHRTEEDVKLLFEKELQTLEKIEARTRQMYQKIAYRKRKLIQEQQKKWEMVLSASNTMSQMNSEERNRIFLFLQDEEEDEEDEERAMKDHRKDGDDTLERNNPKRLRKLNSSFLFRETDNQERLDDSNILEGHSLNPNHLKSANRLYTSTNSIDISNQKVNSNQIFCSPPKELPRIFSERPQSAVLILKDVDLSFKIRGKNALSTKKSVDQTTLTRKLPVQLKKVNPTDRLPRVTSAMSYYDQHGESKTNNYLKEKPIPPARRSQSVPLTDRPR